MLSEVSSPEVSSEASSEVSAALSFSAAAEVSADVPAAESDVLPQPAKQVAVIAKAAAHAIIFFSFISKVLSLWVCYPADNVLHFSAYVTGILIPVKLAGYSRMRKR